MSSVTEEIKARVDLVELIGRSVQLKKAGSLYRGLCPFHAEKTPSFFVRPQTQSFHCYGCNKSGSAFDWLMEREHLDFGEALRTLANMTGVALPERRTPELEEQTQRLYTILERAQAFYEAALWGSLGQRARAYLSRRGLVDETLKLFGLGYAPSGNGLLRHLEKDGFSEQELQAAGVISISDDGRQFDFFRDRVLFPIRDAQGRAIAFGGRSLDDASTPKYLNSRDTLLFHKQETLFALDLARRPMGQERQVVIVEGYMDALMAHQHGYRNVVATLGTALSDRHLRLLARHVDDILMCMDPDAAGDAASWRALQVADAGLRQGVTPVVGPSRRQQRTVPGRAARLRIMQLPDGRDPDELIRSDPGAWPGLVTRAMPVIDFVLRRMGERHDLASSTGKAAAADEIGEVLATVADPVEQANRVAEVANRLGIQPEAMWLSIRPKLRTAAQRGQANRQWVAVALPELMEGDTLDEYALALLMRARHISGAPAEVEFDFALPHSKALLENLEGEVPEDLQPYLERIRRGHTDIERLSQDQLILELEQTRLRMRKRSLLERKRSLTALMSESDESERRAMGAQLGEVARDIQSIDEQLLPSERERVGAR
jgi:DNA primase